VLTTADIEAIHAATLRVLERTGVLVQDDEAVALLVARGARADGRRVWIPEGAVRAALATAPSAFVLTGRSPERDLVFGEGRGVIATVSGPAYVLDGEEVRPGSLSDVADVARVAHLSPQIGFQGDAIEPLDLREDERTRRSTHIRLTLSDKSTEWIASTDEDLDDAVAINEILWGAGWAGVPRALIVLNTTSPLQLSGENVRLLVRWARLGQPSCVTACVMGGTTGPATPAGTLVVQHAEVLAALVIAQAVRKGSPFVYGGLSTLSDLRTGMATFGTPEFAGMAEATVGLARLCGLPVRAGAAVTDAHVPDPQAMMESALCLGAGVRAGADFILQGAGVLSSFNIASVEKLVMDDELVAMLRAEAQRAGADGEGLAEDVIDAVGPAGSYLGQTHTRRHARDAVRPTFLMRDALEKWQAGGGEELRAAARREVARRLEEHVPPDDLDALVRRQLDGYCLR
jgi:trimethylamine---corrinoid protein Co-methyltransferase